MTSTPGPPGAPRLLAMGSEPFVSLATFRRNGEPVATPVWVARDGEHLVVITPAGTGKVRRLRRDSRATLTPCDRRGRLVPGVAPVEAVATVCEDPATVERTRVALAAKYGLQYRLMMAADRLMTRGRDRTRIALHLRPPLT